MRWPPRRWWYLTAVFAALITGCIDEVIGTPPSVPAPRMSDLTTDATATATPATSSTAPSASASGIAPFSSIDARLSTFERLATQTDLDAGSSSRSVTVFAPTDEAFATTAGPSDRKDAELLRLLQYHVVPGTVTRADLHAGQRLRTLSGDMVTINVTRGNAFVIDSTGIPATLIETDLVAGNVTVHVIDRVLVPDAEGRSRIGP